MSIIGQDIDARDDDGWTPLHAAVYWGSVEAAELLVLSGANMYTKTDTVRLHTCAKIIQL